jgi:hypothetical protein
MKRRWSPEDSAKAALCFVLLVGTVLPFVGCRIAEEKVKEGEAFILGMETYVYGFPLVMMDLTRQVMTATPTAGEFSAPINQFQKLRVPVPWDFNSLWETAFLDLGQEPLVVTVPDAGKIPVAARWLNLWTDAIGTAGLPR